MVGRTLLQTAPPITMGLKLAGWLAAIHRGRKRFTESFAQALVLQFGGAVGTLAALGENGPSVAQELASELGLLAPCTRGTPTAIGWRTGLRVWSLHWLAGQDRTGYQPPDAR